MKKFMTVLLVVAVMFTFSFGSAFAVVNTQGQYLSNLADAEAKVLKNLEGEYAMAKATVTYNGDKAAEGKSYVVDGALWLEQLEVVYADFVQAVKATTVTLQTSSAYTANGDKTVEELVALYTAKNATAFTTELYAAAGKYAAAAAKVQFAADKAEFIANANSVDTTIYSTTEQNAVITPAITYGDTTVETKVYKAYADAVVAKVVYGLEQVKLADTDTTYDLVAAKAAALTLDVIKYDSAKKVYYIDETAGGLDKDLLSTTEEAVAGAQASANKSSKLATLAANVSAAAADPAVVKFNAEELAAWTAAKDAYVEVETYLINNVADYTVKPFPTIAVAKVEGVYKATEATTSYQDAVKDMADVAAVAAAKKAEKSAAGDAAYDAAEVDKLLTAAYKTQYAAAAAKPYTKSTEDFSTAKYAYSTEFAKLSAKAKVEEKVEAEEMKYDSVAYYALEWAKVEAAVAAFNAAVDAAATTPEISKAESDFATAMGKIDTAAEVDDLFEIGGDCYAAANAAQAEIAKYVDVLNLNKEAKDQIAAPTLVELGVWYAEHNARTEKEVKALYADALAWAAAAETAGEIEAAGKAEVAAVEAAIDALPTALNATLADAEAAIAAKEALADAEAKSLVIDAAKKAKLTALLENLATLQGKSIDDQLTAIKKDGLTAADADAFAALEDALEVYEDLKGTAHVDGAAYVTANATNLRNAEKKAVIDAIDALPTTVTAADREAVEAARAAYDAYVAKYTDYAAGDDAAKDITNVTALLMAEAALPVFGDADAKAYVQDLKIVARSVKTAKGNVKVTIKADVEKLTENGYTVEYKFYRSTKSNAKFGTAKKVSESNVYTNTTGKKGVKYFYKAKLVVKNAEGEVVATTPLTQCLYASRTWTK